MKNYHSMLSMMLIGIMILFSSCSDDEDVFYYSFKDITYSVGTGDGMTEYESPWEECYILVNNSETSEVQSGPADIYLGYHDTYRFECDDPTAFNPTVGYVHVPLPEALSSGNQPVLGEKEGEYSMDEVEVDVYKQGKMYPIPPKTKLVVERKVMMKKLVLTYTATFQRHPKGPDHIVTGKFVRHTPMGISLVEKYEPIKN